MRILVTNDDGIHAAGIAVLEEIAAQFSDDVWTVAPAEDHTGAGHSMSLSRPVRLRKHAPKRWSVTGTPTDAVQMGLRHVLDSAPDVVLSGINIGANLGDDITYSGTVSAAMEGSLGGVKSIAMSQVFRREGMDENDRFAAAREWGPKVLAPLLEAEFAPRTLVNVNFPPIPAAGVAGIRAVRQGFHDYSRGTIEERRDPRGQRYYWFGLAPMEHTPDHGTDLEAIDEGYVSVTPLQLDLTDHSQLASLAERLDR